MKKSEVIMQIMYDYEELGNEKIIELCNQYLNQKMIRWLGIHHPDNRTRKLFFRATNIEIGHDTVILENFVVYDGYKPLLKIGNRCSIGTSVTVICESYPNNSPYLQQNSYVKEKLIVEKPVVIEDDVWIGPNSILLPGVVIGEKSIIGAGSVVTRDVPPYSISAGVPAKIIRSIREADIS